MAQVEVAGFHRLATPCSIASAAIDSLSSELSSEIHAILDSLTTHPAPTSSKNEPCLWDEPCDLGDTYCNTQYSIHATSATPQHVHPFHMMEQTQYSVPSTDTMAPTPLPMSIRTCDPSAVNLNGTHKMSLVSAVNELTLPMHSPTTPLCARVSQTECPVPQYPTLLPFLPQSSLPSHMQSQMPQLAGTTEHESSTELEDMSWTYSTSQARTTQNQYAGHDEESEASKVLSLHRNRAYYGIQEPRFLQSAPPSKLVCHISNVLGGSKAGTKLASPNMASRLTSTPRDGYLNSTGCFASYLDQANKTASVRQPYSKTETPALGRYTGDLSLKKKGQRSRKKRSQLGQYSTGDGIYQGMKLWQFLLQLLVRSKHSTIICWTSKQEGTFKVIDSEALAKLWGRHKNRPEMNYDKMSRAMRYYYNKNLLDKVPRRLYYQFKYFSKWWERLEAFEPDFRMIRVPEPPHPSSKATIDFLSDSERSDSESPACSDMERDALSLVTATAIADNQVHSL